jgi:hypothetical protein
LGGCTLVRSRTELFERRSTLYVVVIHSISRPEEFWGAAEQGEFPEGVNLHSALPNADGSRAVCLWEAESPDTVRDLVEGTVGEFSSNEYFEVNAQNAQGLPG